MIDLVENLEHRRLLSVAPNPANVPADESAVWFDIERIYSQVYTAGTKLGGDAQAVSVDIKSLNSTPQLQSQKQTLRNDVTQSADKLWNDALAVFQAGASDAWAVVSDGVALYFDQWVPSAFPAAQTKLATDEAKLQADIAPSVAIFKQDFTAAQTLVGADVQAIVNSYPTDTQLQADQHAFATDLSATTQALATDEQTFATDVTTLLRDKFGTT